METTSHEHERIAALLRMLPPAPASWTQAAQELPAARRSLDDIVARAEADAAYRQSVIADLEAALADAGLTAAEPLVRELRRRLPAE
jgi:hypothetical protein